MLSKEWALVATRPSAASTTAMKIRTASILCARRCRTAAAFCTAIASGSACRDWIDDTWSPRLDSLPPWTPREAQRRLLEVALTVVAQAPGINAA